MVVKTTRTKEMPDLQRRKKKRSKAFTPRTTHKRPAKHLPGLDLTAGIPIVPSPETTPTSELPEVPSTTAEDIHSSSSLSSDE